MMVDDPILCEIRRVRAEHAAEFGYDIRAMLRDLKEKQRMDQARGVKYVRLPARRDEPAPAAK